MDTKSQSLTKHNEWKGKIEVVSRIGIKNKEELSLAYTPGVAEPCMEIYKDPSLSYEYTRRGNLVAVITDGSAVLGLGNIGGLAGMPVMEGKCCLFKEFADIDAFPICIKSNDVEKIISTIELIADSFGGINLEDISAPRCFEIERRLKEKLDIPVFHDDQHGTAIVVGAALINALKCVRKSIDKITVVINGAGSAGVAIARFLKQLGVLDITAVDIEGVINRDAEYKNPVHTELASWTNSRNIKGTLSDALKDADVFVGVSQPNLVTEKMIRSMAEKPVIFAMANPLPEIMPDDAKAAGAYIVGTGRSDFPNQINNLLAFPGIFKGALSVHARDITDEMKIAAAFAIAGMIPENELNPSNIIPNPLNKKVADAVAKAVSETYLKSNG